MASATGPALTREGETEAPHPRRRFVGIGTLLIGTAVILWVGAATLIAHRLRYPPFLGTPRGDVFGKTIPAGPLPADPRAAFGADFNDVTIATPGGHRVRAWFIVGMRRQAMVLVPAAGGSRAMMLPYARFLHAARYPLLLLDSIDTPNTGTDWGWSARKVVAAAAQTLKDRGYERVGALGVSEGGAAAIFAQAENPATPAFAAIVADSPYSNLEAMLRQSPTVAGLNPAFARTALLEARWWLGRSPRDIAPAAAAAHLGDCRLLIVQNRADPMTPSAQGLAIRDAARGDKGAQQRAGLWLTPTSGHGDAIYELPAQYSIVVDRFLKRSLAVAPAASPRHR
jgi:hypothetical protein